MKPERTNYEIWFIDYLDGNLDENAVRELLEFLDENPDLKEEFSELSDYSLIPPDSTYSLKNNLKKSFSDLSDDQFDYLCIAGMEKDLPPGQEEELNEIVSKDPGKAERYQQISRLRLKPPDAEYRYKYKLRKLTLAGKITRYSAVVLSAAASLLLLFTLLRPSPVISPEQMVSVLPGDTGMPLVRSAGNLSEVLQPPADEGEAENITLPDKLAPAGKNQIKPDTLPVDIPDRQQVQATVNYQAIARFEIGKIGYRTDVKLSSGVDRADLVAMNVPEYDLSVPAEMPSINDRFARFFREKILKSDNPSYGELKAYEIADAGINGLNRLFGWNLSLEESRNENGDVTSLHFNSRLVKFNAPVKNNEEAR